MKWIKLFKNTLKGHQTLIVREQIKWLCLFFTKDRDRFEDCLRENDVIPDKNERDRLKKCLQDGPYSKTHSKVLSAYWLLFAIISANIR